MSKSNKSGFYNTGALEFDFDEVDYAVVPTNGKKVDMEDEKIDELVENNVDIIKKTFSNFVFEIISVEDDKTFNICGEVTLDNIVLEDLIIDFREGNYIFSHFGVRKVD